MGFQTLKAMRARSALQKELRARLKTMLAQALALGPDDCVHVDEIACPDPVCADSKTVVLVMRAGEPTRAIDIPHGLDRITAADCDRVAVEEHACRGA